MIYEPKLVKISLAMELIIGEGDGGKGTEGWVWSDVTFY